MPPSADEDDGYSLVPLDQFGSDAETEVVLGLLRSSGIPAVHAGQYSTKVPNQILVPAKCVADALQLIANRSDVPPDPPPGAEQFADEPRPLVTTIAAAIRILFWGALLLIGLWVLWLSRR